MPAGRDENAEGGRRRAPCTRSGAEQWGEMFANAARNLEENRIALIQALARKAQGLRTVLDLIIEQ